MLHGFTGNLGIYIATFTYLLYCLAQKELPPKKRRLERVDTPIDLEATPRPAVRNFPSSSTSISLSRSLSRSLSASRSRAGSTSRSSSPKKQMISLSLDDTIVYTELIIDTVPVAAKELYETLEDFAENKNILPHSFQQAISQQQAITRQLVTTLQQATSPQQANAQLQKLQNKVNVYEKLKSCCRPESAPDDNLPGRIPSLNEIDEIVRKAIQVGTRGNNKSRWNGAVNLRLLDMIFEDPLTGPISEFGATDWQVMTSKKCGNMAANSYYLIAPRPNYIKNLDR